MIHSLQSASRHEYILLDIRGNSLRVKSNCHSKYVFLSNTYIFVQGLLRTSQALGMWQTGRAFHWTTERRTNATLIILLEKKASDSVQRTFKFNFPKKTVEAFIYCIFFLSFFPWRTDSVDLVLCTVTIFVFAFRVCRSCCFHEPRNHAVILSGYPTLSHTHTLSYTHASREIHSCRNKETNVQKMLRLHLKRPCHTNILGVSEINVNWIV